MEGSCDTFKGMPASASAPSSKSRARKLRLIPLLAATYFMVSGGPYDLEDIIGYGGYTWALVMLTLLPFFWSFPTAMMLGELAAAIPEDGGFYAWVRRAMGEFWGFQEAWLSLAASAFDMAIYPTTFVLYLERVAPVMTEGHRGLLLKLLVVVAAILWNLRGAAAVGEGSIKLWAVSISPYLVLIAIAVYIGLTHPMQGHHAHMGPPADKAFSTAFLVALWNYMGWDNATTIANEVDNPQRNYPRVMLIAACMVMLTYLIPVAAVAWAGLPSTAFTTGAWADAGRTLGGSALAFTIVIAGVIDDFGTFSNLTLSYTRLPHAMACDGLLPKVFTKQLKNGAPWVSILVCGFCWSLAFCFTFEGLITIDLLLYSLSILLEFISLILLRKREPGLHRPFRIPGPDWIPIVLAASPTLLTVYALYAARDEHLLGMPAIVFASILVACGPPLYLLARARRQRSLVTR